MARACRLPPTRFAGVTVERDVAVTMPDGAVLLADRWHAPSAGRAPAVLVRTPYGRRPFGMTGRLLAERGYQVLVQSCRGTFGSGGEWNPFHNESADGKATLAWAAGQPWFGGVMGTWGPSYLGLAQWAVAADPPEYLKAMAMQVTASRFRDAVVYPGGSFAYETGASWLHQLEYQELGWWRVLAAQLRAPRALEAVSTTLPLALADSVGIGRRIGYYHDWLEHNHPDDSWWEELDFGRDVTSVPPVSMVAGWYDIFLPSQILDYAALRDAGRPARLTVGPWTHTSPAGMAAGLRDGLDWFDTHLADGSAPWGGRPRDPAGPPAPVRLFVMGSRRWVGLSSWPPPAEPQRWHLHPQGILARQPAPSGPVQPDRFRYDPADPTPGVGGASLNWRNAGAKDQKERESRPDVLTYTSGVLEADVTVAGPLGVELWLRSSRPNTDVFVRLCDVSQRGTSRNIADGILRIEPGSVPSDAQGVLRVEVPMWPTAMTFRRGHRIRLQVSSGAHPLFVRNLGSGEPLGSGTTLCPAEQEVFHDSEHPSAIILPVSRI